LSLLNLVRYLLRTVLVVGIILFFEKKNLQSGFEIIQILPAKIFTPNNDGWNDYLEIQYSNLNDALVSGKIFDLKGGLVAYMEKDTTKEILKWDGKDTQGRMSPGGVYIYQIEISGSENKVINGTVILAR